MTSKSRFALFGSAVAIVLIVCFLIFAKSTSAPVRIIELSAADAKAIERSVSSFRWAQLRRAIRTGNVDRIKVAIAQITNAKAHEIGALHHPASDAVEGYLTCGTTNRFYMYTLVRSSNRWTVVSASVGG